MNKIANAKKRGAKKKRSPQLARLLCTAIQRGTPSTHACALAGISNQTFYTWLNDDPGFRSAIEKAKAAGIEARLKRIESAARQDWRAAAWWLEHVHPGDFGRTRLEVEAVGQIDHAFVVPRETLDQIAEARKLADERERKQLTQPNGP